MFSPPKLRLFTFYYPINFAAVRSINTGLNTTGMDDFKRLTVEALKCESEAAKTFAAESNLEPTRSVLFRSAATLAVECQELRVAEQLISAALAGNPPAEIADELRDLLEDVYFNRHLELRGVKLAPGEVQMMLEGDGVGFGMTRSEAFIQRVNVLETMLYRTAERLLGRAFREAGREKRNWPKHSSCIYPFQERQVSRSHLS